ncbi:MAG TPA: site-2 protease family protein [Blastocatellia bacterium]|nr:site-2 protease family protein [Blastocatellia bacterium]
MDIDIGYIILWFIVLLFSLSFHEAAHAWTSEKFGDDTGRRQGRITLNPLPHIDPIGTVVFPLIMAITSIPLFGWAKPVETNPNLWRDKTKANISVSAAGPISNFILAAAAFIILKSLIAGGLAFPVGNAGVVPMPGQPAFMEPLTLLLNIMLALNLALGVFNLIPIPPLDGSHVLESLLPDEMAQAYAQIQPYGFILLIALMYIGVFGYIYFPVRSLVFGLLAV